MQRVSSEEVAMMKGEYLRSKSEHQEMALLASTSQSKSSMMEKLVSDWKEECRLIVHKGRIQEDQYEVEANAMRSEILSLSHSLLTSRAATVSSTDEAISSRCFVLDRERDELKSSVA